MVDISALKDPVPVTPELAPGLFTEATDRQAVNRWKDGNNVRFHEQFPQKIGGWKQPVITGSTFLGKARRVWEWQSIDRQNWIAIGTNAKLYLLNQNVYYDITPIRRFINLTDPFTTTNGSATVTVTDVGHDAISGDFVRFSGATAVGGITISGEYKVVSIVNTTQYTILHTVVASSGATGGGAGVTAEYDINNGGEDTGLWYGWGTCTWGNSTWGTPRGICSTMPRNLRIWSLANWGEDLLASPSEGAVYYWDRTFGPNSRATLVEQAPATNQRILVSSENRQLVCLGAHDGSRPDPLRIRVSNNEDFTDFKPVDDNGDPQPDDRSYNTRIDSGSKILTGVSTRSGILIFTDVSVHLMQPDETLVYFVRQLSEGNSVISPNSVIEIDGVVYWMSGDKFMMFDGVIQEIPCEIWSKVFGKKSGQGVNPAQRDKVYTWYNDVWNEIWHHYPSTGSIENDTVAVFSRKGQGWTYHSMARTAGNVKSPFYGYPYAISTTGRFFQHELGQDDDTSLVGGAAAAIDSFLESYDIQLGEGQEAAHVSKAVPDTKYQTGNVSLSLKVRRRPRANQTTKGPYVITPTTIEKGVRAKGRQVAIRMAQNVIAGDWRNGNWTFYITPDSET